MLSTPPSYSSLHQSDISFAPTDDPLRQGPHLLSKLDISATQCHAPGPNTDSGYASSPSVLSAADGRSSLYAEADHAPTLLEMYAAWKAADAAAQRLPTEVQAMEACEAHLAEARRKAAASGTGNSPTRLKRRLSSLSLLRKRSVPAAPTPLFTSPIDGISPSSPTYESTLDLAEIEREILLLQRKVHGTRLQAEQMDGCFDKIVQYLDDESSSISPASLKSPSIMSGSTGHSSLSMSDSYRTVRKKVATRDEAFLDTKSTTADVQRACRAVQAAHRLYKEAKETLGSVCGPERGMLAVLFADEESRNKTYLEAAERAREAQLCFNECLSKLKPHWEFLSRHEVEAYENLKNTGLLQAATMAELMYGGRNLDMGIRQQVQFMIQRQNDVYLHLTNFANGVQNCATHCESVERETRAARDAARRQLLVLAFPTETYSMTED
ncbi:hypothetical protein C8Q77DRAFT_1272363 [Trametes polyzona]|nr:hypothetical protein C8Q77DRAFT_1272363 [Trametes polyzona]